MNVNPLFDLRGRVAVVTGATRGIGWATARELANAGAAVAVSSEDVELAKERAETLAADGKQALGGKFAKFAIAMSSRRSSRKLSTNSAGWAIWSPRSEAECVFL